MYEPKCGGEGGSAGLRQWVQLDTEAQINFGDLTPYLTYAGIVPPGMVPEEAPVLLSVGKASPPHPHVLQESQVVHLHQKSIVHIYATRVPQLNQIVLYLVHISAAREWIHGQPDNNKLLTLANDDI